MAFHMHTMPKHVFYDLSYSIVMGETIDGISDLKHDYKSEYIIK
jgi:hypothetical protein